MYIRFFFKVTVKAIYSVIVYCTCVHNNNALLSYIDSVLLAKRKRPLPLLQWVLIQSAQYDAEHLKQFAVSCGVVM
jgi:hypothetical protein